MRPLPRTTWVKSLFFSRAYLVISESESEQAWTCPSGVFGQCEGRRPPFAEAAVWAVGALPEACGHRPEDGQGGLTCEWGECDWEQVPAVWRYAWNNLRLAVAAASPEHRARLGDDVPGRLLELHAFIDRLGDDPWMWCGNWHQASALASGLLEGLRPWLAPDAYRAGPPLLVPGANHGLRFPVPGRSVQVPTDGPQSGVVLGNSAIMPLFGLGVPRLQENDGATYRTARWALDGGCRHLDVTRVADGMAEVGRALRDSGIPRVEVFLAVEFGRASDGAGKTSESLEARLRALGVDYADVAVFTSAGEPWPAWKAAWRQLEELHFKGRVRALGVAGLGIDALSELFDHAAVKPVYLQAPFSVHHFGSRDEARKADSLMEWLSAHGMTMVARNAARLDSKEVTYLSPPRDPHVLAVASRVGRSPAQVLHRWLLQLGAAVVSWSPLHAELLEDAQVFDFSLDETEMRLLNGLAALAASSPGRRAPLWCEDVYNLSHLSDGEWE